MQFGVGNNGFPDSDRVDTATPVGIDAPDSIKSLRVAKRRDINGLAWTVTRQGIGVTDCEIFVYLGRFDLAFKEEGSHAQEQGIGTHLECQPRIVRRLERIAQAPGAEILECCA